jgi:hypothetical protein
MHQACVCLHVWVHTDIALHSRWHHVRIVCLICVVRHATIVRRVHVIVLLMSVGRQWVTVHHDGVTVHRLISVSAADTL